MPDNLNLYKTFQNLSEDAQERVRNHAGAQQVEADPDQKAEIAKRQAKIFDDMMLGVAPPVPVTALADQMEAAQRHAESWVENYYRKQAPAFMAAHLLYGADDFFRSIVTKALAVHDNFFSEDGEGITHGYRSNDPNIPHGPDTLIAISTSRPGHRWLIHNQVTLSRVASGVKNDSWCDIDISGTGYCIRGMREYKADKHAWRYMDYVPNLPTLIPFSNGNVVIFGHVCYACWRAYTKKSKIRPDKCEIFHPICDGFGSL